MRRIAAASFCAVLASACSGGGNTTTAAPAVVTPYPGQTLQSAIKNVIVIYQENWSFDGLYGRYPGANGLANASASSYAQVDKVTGQPITVNPQPLIGGAADTRFPSNLPVQPYSAAQYVPASGMTGDIVHRYYQERSQIDGGKMDQFLTWSDNPGLVLSNYDATNMPEGLLAQQYVMMDNFFHSTFGGSFMNHQFLICACVATFPNAPSAAVATLNADGSALALDANGKIVHDGFVTPDGYAVNTAFSVNQPHPASVPAANLVPQQTQPTIGDRLDAKNVSWKWYSGGWNNALAGNPDRLFQFHHQPFAYYQSYADGTQAKAQHLQDEQNFLSDLQNGTLPAVSFIKPLGPDNEHPGYASLAQGQAHVAALVQAVQQSPYWKNAAIVITYDEHGGRWDHVAPPVLDRWGPGERAPAILISPWAKHGYVDHTQYETVSVLSLIEKIWGLQPLTTRDAAAAPLQNAFDFSQTGAVLSSHRR